MFAIGKLHPGNAVLQLFERLEGLADLAYVKQLAEPNPGPGPGPGPEEESDEEPGAGADDGQQMEMDLGD